MQSVNLKGQMKKSFIYEGQSLNNRDRCLYVVEIDVRQLHFLDLVHNDISLSNVLFDEDTSIIIDFNVNVRSAALLAYGSLRTYLVFMLHLNSWPCLNFRPCFIVHRQAVYNCQAMSNCQAVSHYQTVSHCQGRVSLSRPYLIVKAAFHCQGLL